MKEQGRRLERLYSIDGLRPVDEPIVLAEIGRGHPIVAVTAAMHGDEDTGVYILDTLRKTLQSEKGTVRLVVANPPALFQGARYLSEDLNRAFPGDQNGLVENGLAPKVLEIVKDSDFTIDLHTTSADTETFVILGKRNEERLRLGEATGLQKIVFIEGTKDCAMVDFVKCGIGIELGLHGSDYTYQAGLKAVKNVLGSLGMVPSCGSQEINREYYELFGSIKCSPHPYTSITTLLQNFVPVSKGEKIVQISEIRGGEPLSFGQMGPFYIDAEEDFYPLFVGERAYKDTICLQARKVSRQELLGEKI